MDGTGETAGRLLEDDDPVTPPKGPPEPAGHFDLTGDDDVVDVLAHELSSLHSPTVVECNYPRCTFSNAELKPNPCDFPGCDRRVHHFCCATFCNRHGLADPEGQTRYCWQCVMDFGDDFWPEAADTLPSAIEQELQDAATSSPAVTEADFPAPQASQAIPSSQVSDQLTQACPTGRYHS